MDLDPEGLFRDDSDSEEEMLQEKEANKDMVVYLVDASPRMFADGLESEVDDKKESHFRVVVSCIAQALKTQIISNSYDEVAICFFNTKEKKNLQDQNGVYVYNVGDREPLDRPTARLIKELSALEDSFASTIGSCYGITSGSRDNTLYNALWVAQALLREGSSKTASKRIVLFTNEDDPFGSITGPTKMDMIRTTIQRAKDAQDLGILVELLPLTRENVQFDMSIFYADMLGLEDDEIVQYLPSADEKLEDMKDQLRKQMFKKRKIRSLLFSITKDVSIEVNTYAMIRPSFPGGITWLDSVTNLPLKVERSFICNDTGALLQEPPKRFQNYNNQMVKFSARELAEVKKATNNHLCLLGFKPIDCLKDYHNLKPATFIYPNDEEISGSTRVFVALHTSMLRLRRFAVAFYGSSSRPQLVALIAQEEITSLAGQEEPPGMYMIYLPYSDDIRLVEELHTTVGVAAPRATEGQIMKASTLLKRIDLKDFSFSQLSNPALQRHYGILQALALDEDDMPEIKDETLPDEEGMSRPAVVKAVEEFKISVYGENHDEEEAAAAVAKAAPSEASKKRKASAEAAVKECADYNWENLADSGKLKDMTVAQLKIYLSAHRLPLSGKKEALVARVLSHMGK